MLALQCGQRSRCIDSINFATPMGNLFSCVQSCMHVRQRNGILLIYMSLAPYAVTAAHKREALHRIYLQHRPRLAAGLIGRSIRPPASSARKSFQNGIDARCLTTGLVRAVGRAFIAYAAGTLVQLIAMAIIVVWGRNNNGYRIVTVVGD